jgi:D-isomer specific 2-hydroxyacid dehydrogenase, catalytic domain
VRVSRYSLANTTYLRKPLTPASSRGWTNLADLPSRLSPSTYSVGVDHIDLQAAAQRHIAIGYTPTAVTDATADIAMLLLLGASRRGFEEQELVRTGEWTIPRSGALLGWQLTDKNTRHPGHGTNWPGSREARPRLWHENPLLEPSSAAGGRGRRCSVPFRSIGTARRERRSSQNLNRPVRCANW